MYTYIPHNTQFSPGERQSSPTQTRSRFLAVEIILYPLYPYVLCFTILSFFVYFPVMCVTISFEMILSLDWSINYEECCWTGSPSKNRNHLRHGPMFLCKLETLDLELERGIIYSLANLKIINSVSLSLGYKNLSVLD